MVRQRCLSRRSSFGSESFGARRDLTAALLALLLLLAGSACRRGGISVKGMNGVFLNAAAIPTADGGCRLWILTDASLTYIKTVRRPGYFSTGRACLSCKTRLYVYDPVSGAILQKFSTGYKTIVTQTWMAHVNGQVWIASGPYHENEPRVFIYKTDPPGLFDETAGLIARYPELSSGLVNVRMEKDPLRLVFETKDGRTNLVLTLEDMKFYPTQAAYREFSDRRDRERITIHALGREGSSGPRERLYRVTGDRYRISGDFLQYMLGNLQTLKGVANGVAEVETPDRVFLDGLILYQDADGCLILDQEAAGPVSDRRLTFVGSAGRVKWTVPQAGLFPELRVDTNRTSGTRMDLLKSGLEGSRAGRVLVLQFKGVGLAGFDIDTGRRLWQIKS
jgi:hypothetical protein